VRIGLFVPCYVEHLEPRVGLAVARILRRLGHEVVVPEGAPCCGQPAWSNGLPHTAAHAARRFVRAFSRHAADLDAFVCPSGSCTAMVREGYAELPLSVSETRALAEVAPRFLEFTEFLVDRAGAEDVGASLPNAIAVHTSCQALRRIGVAAQPRRLVEHARGARLAPLARPEECCGFGGAFAVRLPELSLAMADDKLDDALGVGAEILTGVDSSCLMHLRGRARARGLTLRVEHIAVLLAEGMGLL
jgi:L-lactate dehydrogenase complex protein LldE